MNTEKPLSDFELQSMRKTASRSTDKWHPDAVLALLNTVDYWRLHHGDIDRYRHETFSARVDVDLLAEINRPRNPMSDDVLSGHVPIDQEGAIVCAECGDWWSECPVNRATQMLHQMQIDLNDEHSRRIRAEEARDRAFAAITDPHDWEAKADYWHNRAKTFEDDAKRHAIIECASCGAQFCSYEAREIETGVGADSQDITYDRVCPICWTRAG